MDRTVLERKALAELREIASTLELRGYQRMKKADLVDLIMNAGGQPGGNGAEGGASGGPQAQQSQDGGENRERNRTRAPVDALTRDDAEGERTRQRSREAEDDPGRDANGRGADEAGGDQPGSDQPGSRQAGGGQAGRTPADGDQAGGGHTVEDRTDKARTDRDRAGDDQDDKDQRDKDQRDRSHGNQQPSPSRGDPQGGGSRDDGQGGGGRRSKRERRRKSRGGGGGQQQENLDDAEVREGVLDLLPEGYGFLRCTGYLSGNKDVYVSQSFVRRFNLRRGDMLSGPIRRNKNNDKFPALGRVDTIEGEKIHEGDQKRRTDFKDLTPLFPDERFSLEIEERSPIAMRLIDMMAPIGKGQRGLIVSPPKAGKTTILKQLAHAIETNNPETHLMVLLVDERPEEVTDFERSTGGEVISSTFDRPADDHTQVAELCIERAKRLVENGKDVVILLDSITRLGRAYNLAAPASGRILSGGIDSAAIYPPKRFFGAARNIEEGGSLTIIATALIETGSKMDEVIFEEFKGTGNLELRLDRRMEQKRIFPAVDIQASGTRREELLLGRDELETVWKLRRLLASMDSGASLELLIDKLKATKSNEQFLQIIAKSNLQ